MFNCTVVFSCDICGYGIKYFARRKTDTPSHAWARYVFKEKGWRVVYGKYDVCDECISYYGLKKIRNILYQRKKDDEKLS